MKSKTIILAAVTGIIIFTAGFLIGRAGAPSRKGDLAQGSDLQQVQAGIVVSTAEGSAESAAAGNVVRVEALRFRVDDGNVQWFDGIRWNTVAAVEELASQDKFALAKTALEEFEIQYEAQQEAGQQGMEPVPFGREENKVLTGMKENPKTVMPKPTPVPEVKTETPAPVQDQDGNNSGNNSGSNNSGNDSGGNSGGNDSGSNDSGNQQEESAETGADEGDGEDMEFGDWFE